MFKGWVPTVTGRLAFSTVGRSSHPTPAICTNIADSENRYIISYQKRPLLDAVLPFKYTLGRWFLGLEGNFWLLLLAKSSNMVEDNGDLKGSVLVFHGSKSWRAIQNQVRTVQAKADKYYHELHPGKLQEYIENDFESLGATLKPHSSYNIEFSLLRNGICTIQIPTNMIRSPSAPRFPEADKEALEHIVCSQIFFFLKDISHNHQHHSPQTDTLLDVFRVKDSDDKLWMSETLRVLYRKILQYKRSNDEEVHSSSLGMLAYIKSFIKISNKVTGSNIEPNLDTDSLEFSIRANQEKVSTNIQNKIRKSDSLRNTIIALVGLLISFVGLTSISKSNSIGAIEPHRVYIELSSFLLKEPFLALGIVSAIYIGLLVMMKIIDISKLPPVRGLVRLFQPLKQKLFGALMLTSAALIAGLTYMYAFGI